MVEKRNKDLLAVRIPPVDYDWLEQRAGELGISISEFARRIISDARIAAQGGK